MATVKEDPHSWKAGNVQHRDFRAAKNGPEVTGKPKKRKDKRLWCKGKEGREHTIVVKLTPHTWWFHHGEKSCHENEVQSWLNNKGWTCYHVRLCSRCNRIMEEWLNKEECPTWIRQANEARPKS